MSEAPEEPEMLTGVTVIDDRPGSGPGDSYDNLNKIFRDALLNGDLKEGPQRENLRSNAEESAYSLIDSCEPDGPRAEKFVRELSALLVDFNRRALPEKPIRDFDAATETLLEYIRSPEGYGPWLAAGALTRPLMRNKSIKAYWALMNWLRNNKLPSDIVILSKSEIVNQRSTDPKRLREAYATLNAARKPK